MLKRRRKLYKAGVLGGGGISGAQRLQTYLDAINENKVGNMLLMLPLNETEGAEALDYSGNDYHADYFGSSMTVGGASGPLAGNVAPQMGGTQNEVRLNNATWRTAFDGTKGHLSFWLKLDELVNETQIFVSLWSNTSFERIIIQKSGVMTLTTQYAPATAAYTLNNSTPALSGWINVQMSWSDSNNGGFVTMFVNGVQVQTFSTVAVPWTGTTLNTYVAGPTLDGAMALLAVFDEVQDADSRAALATLPGGVQA